MVIVIACAIVYVFLQALQVGSVGSVQLGSAGLCRLLTSARGAAKLDREKAEDNAPVYAVNHGFFFPFLCQQKVRSYCFHFTR